MNTQTQTTKKPLIPPQSPQPIIIRGRTFEFINKTFYVNYTKTKLKDLRVIKSHTLNYELWGKSELDAFYTSFICLLNKEEKELLNLWLDHCKGFQA